MNTRQKKITIFTVVVGMLVAATGGICGSPYSANGIGNIIPDDFGRARGRGGAGSANNGEMNLIRDNPALASSFDTFTYSLEARFEDTTTHLEGGEKAIYRRLDLQMFKIVLPLTGNLVFDWSLSPYSRMDTNIEFQNVQDGVSVDDMLTTFGGINVSNTRISYTFKDFLSIGYSLNYYFGMIQEEWKRTFPENDGLHKSQYYIKRKYNGYGNSVGALVQVLENASVGLAYTARCDLDHKTFVIADFPTNPEKRYVMKKTSLPEKWLFGIFYKTQSRLKGGMDFSCEKWESAAHTAEEKEMYTNNWHFGTGVTYTHSISNQDPYIKRLPVSVGFKAGTLYYKSFPKIETVTEKAVTLGLELPLQRNIGSIVISFEYGRRGDQAKNGWDEDFMSVGFSLLGKIN